MPEVYQQRLRKALRNQARCSVFSGSVALSGASSAPETKPGDCEEDKADEQRDGSHVRVPKSRFESIATNGEAMTKRTPYPSKTS
jgi:hypothetical protein